jgi:hypothetical protein
MPSADAAHAMKRVCIAAVIAFSMCGNIACAETDAELRHATAAFYRVYLEVRPSGVPHSRARVKFVPVISRTLEQLLDHAEAAERHYAKVTKRQVPPLVEGDIFTSLFEGAQAYALERCERSTAATTCTVTLRHGPPGEKTTVTWADKVYLVRHNGRWLVDDIEFGGNWQFMHKGHLRDLLRRIIRDGNNELPK